MKQFLSFLTTILSVLNMSAQTDAAKYFTNNPFGWATCQNVDGTQYAMRGGAINGYESAKTITLKAKGNGATDDTNISNAIKTYDVIILDGSNGDFTIASQIKITNTQNKTIVGINNARLCTKFFLTSDMLTKLKAYNLEKLSSTTQMTGTLPNGETLTCDERAFYTKKALMEVTGDYNLTFKRSGIFSFNSTDQNIIIRNLTFVGPGSIDIDGVDLISQYGATFVWIDHCDFIDGLDGCLDSGKREGTPMFVTYSWNKFHYTERSFSHSYCNGTGWMSGKNHQYITYANCWWAEGCGRRLPQADDVDIHVLNCYYTCTGNAAGIAINARSNALVEGTVSIAGVKNPLAFGTTNDIFYTRRNNSFATAPALNSEYSNGSQPVSVPYNYIFIPTDLVPSVLTGPHGAGATLDNNQVLPDFSSNGTPSAIATVSSPASTADMTFNLSGQVAGPSHHGVTIANGKKTLHR